MNDTKTYPPCLQNEDCKKNHLLQDHACFQYFCYPWKKTSEDRPGGEEEEEEDAPLKLCRKSKQCSEGQTCFRNYNRRGVSNGVCLDKAEVEDCVTHEDCPDKKCCNGYCCSQQYFEALMTLPCTSDMGCQVRKSSKSSSGSRTQQTLSQFCSLKIRGATNFMQFRNVVRRILKLQNCERDRPLVIVVVVVLTS